MTLAQPASRSFSAHPPGPIRPDIIVIGASAGGLAPLKELLAGLPSDLLAAVFVVVHIPEHVASALTLILGRAGGLSCAPLGGRGEPIEYGRIYVAAPGRHLTLSRRRVRNGRGPKLGHHRPSVDILFRSAAAAFGPRVVGIVLSGYLCDGSAGLSEIRRFGGTTIVQDPKEAECREMPRNAIRRSVPDYCVPAQALGSLLQRLTRRRK